MGMNIGKILGSQQAYNWLGQFGGAMAPEGSGAARLGGAAQNITGAQIEQEARKKQQKEEEKKKKAGLFGKLGSTAGTLVGVALAPATGGLSLLGPALGGAVGQGAGELVGGGGFSPSNMLASGLAGGSIAGLGNLQRTGSLLGKAKPTAALGKKAAEDEAARAAFNYYGV